MSLVRADRLAGALWGLFAGDAIASPVHWYYDLRQLKSDFGEIKGYEAPKLKLRGSILSLSSTSGGGRGAADGSIIGDVINHGKLKYWGRGLDFHYHCTLQKGENTLEAQLARVALRGLARSGGALDRDAWVHDFIAFMTTPGSHNDTYASTYLRMFFASHAAGVPPEKCPGNDGHNVDSIDALTVCGVIAVAAWARGDDRSTAAASVGSFLQSTRKSDVLPRFGALYTDLLFDVLESPEGSVPATVIRSAAANLAAKIKVPLAKMASEYPGNQNPMTACYMDSALPALLVFLHKYADDPQQCLLASANAGGENVARGSVLGTVMGAAYGKDGLPAWMVPGLHDTAAIDSEISALVTAVDLTVPKAADGAARSEL